MPASNNCLASCPDILRVSPSNSISSELLLFYLNLPSFIDNEWYGVIIRPGLSTSHLLLFVLFYEIQL